jgi:predicted transcriptional regulator
MRLKEIVEKLNLRVLTAEERLEKDVSGGYASDLLSDVIANSREKNVWITLQTHQNVVAVAKLKDLTAIIIVNDRQPEELTLKKAAEEKIPLLSTDRSAFEIAGRLYELMKTKD